MSSLTGMTSVRKHSRSWKLFWLVLQCCQHQILPVPSNWLSTQVMSQDDDVDHPICYFSRKLNKNQRNYSTIEKECLSLILANWLPNWCHWPIRILISMSFFDPPFVCQILFGLKIKFPWSWDPASFTNFSANSVMHCIWAEPAVKCMLESPIIWVFLVYSCTANIQDITSLSRYKRSIHAHLYFFFTIF